MNGSPRTAAGRALLDRVSPPVGDNVDPEEEWVAEAWAHRNEIEGAILAIEAEARAQGALHERLISEGEEAARTAEALGEDAALLHSFVHPDISFDDCDGQRCVRRREQVRAALAEFPVIPDKLGDKT